MTPEEQELRLKALENLSRLDQELGLDDWGCAHGTLHIDGFKLVCTCGACPEQYDVYAANDKKVGYLRLRHGHFRADYPDCGGETVYESQTKGDGVFAEEERLPEIRKALNAITDKLIANAREKVKAKENQT